MATPAQLLGQLAQQFEAAGNPQLANVFRGMASPSGGGVRPGTSTFGNVSVGARPPVGQLAGQLTSPMIGGRSASSFRPPLQLGPGSPSDLWITKDARRTAGQAAARAAASPRSGAGVQQVLGGQLGPFGRGPRPWSEATAFPPAGSRGIPMPRRASSSLVQSMGSPHLNPTAALTRQNAAMRGLASQVPSRTAAAAGGAGAGRPRIPTSAGAGAKGPFQMGPIGSTGPGRPMGNPRSVKAAASALKVSPTSAKPGLAAAGAGAAAAGGGVGHTDYAKARIGVKNWAKTFRNPVKIFESARDVAKGKGGRIRGTAAGSSAAGVWKAANPAMAVASVGYLLRVHEWYDEGTQGDQVAEGMLIGASFGASWGGIGALVGAPVGMALNVLTQGKAADYIQQMPVLGAFFGEDVKEKFDISKHGRDMFATAAKLQGVENPDEVVEAATKQLEMFNSMFETAMLDPEQAFQMVLTSGRIAGLTGFPWNPEELTPIYSAEDISAITSTISDELRPLHDVANGLRTQDFSHIADEATRARLIAVAQRAAGDIEEGFAASVGVPAQSAILAGAQQRQTSQSLGGQLPGLDDFGALLSGVG